MINNLYKERITEAMNEVARKFQVNETMKFSYFFVLCELYHEGCPLNLTNLSKRVGVKLPNISNQTNDLMNIGLIETCQMDENKRKVTVKLSELGQKYSDALVVEIDKVAHEIYGTDDEIENALHYFKMIYQRHFGEKSHLTR